MVKSALRKLSDRLPTLVEIEEIMNSLRNERDYAAAIVASSILDARLEDLLRSKVRVNDKKTLDQLFGNNGILTTFNARIVAAHAFGVINTPLADLLHAIRSIRNVFAHAKFNVSFEHEEIAKEILSTNLVAEIRSLHTTEQQNLDNKTWFLLSVKFILIVFDTLKLSPKGPDSAIKDALEES